MKRLFILASTALVMASCSQDVLVDNGDDFNSSTNTIEFGLSMADNATKASRLSGKTFQDGDKIAVFGFQNDGTDVNQIFKDQLVAYNGTDWKYTPVKYWTSGSIYEFYSMFPQTQAHSFSADKMFSINDFTVADDADKQVDVMIAKQKLNVKPFNTVDFVFTHMLSNVNFYIKGVDQSVSNGIVSVDVLNFDVTGLNSKGTYTQSGWTSNGAAEGMWMVDTDSEYDLPEVTNVNYPITSTKAKELAADLLLMPQDIQSEAVISIKYRLNYEDGSSVTFKKSMPFAAIVGKSSKDSRPISSWYPAYRYNYYMTFNPAKMNGAPATDTSDKDDTERPTDKILVVIPDTDGDLEDEYWIDEDGDGTPDYPLVWDDPDGDGIENLYPDHDGDGIPDFRDPEPGKDPDGNDYTGDTDGDGIPDDVWIDEDGDGDAETELERPAPTVDPVDPEIPVGPKDPDDPDQSAKADYNGGVDDYRFPSAWIVKGDLTNKTIDDDYMIDTDNDGVGDLVILWKDIDGDGRLEGVVDKDGDGVLTEADTYDGDGMGGYYDPDQKPYTPNSNYQFKPNYYDVIMVDTDGDGLAETPLRRDKNVDDPDVETDMIIEFDATVEDWIDAYDVDINVTQ